ncbi:MAG: ABC transporter ATP-binding protein [Alphaproteobacteria bacterium]|nr:ABC transporter ATP-binding protein [Alphaproteobacteria bacterium]
MSPMNSSTARIEAAGLRFDWPGFSLGPLELDLGPGVHRMEGGNGSGKTTLMRCLCGALRPSAGQVRVLGADPSRDPAARAQVAWLPAAPDLPDALRVEEAWQTLAALRGHPRWSGAALCEALDLPPRLRLSDASAGQRRKAELVAALAGDPPALLLDEPFANLDVAAVETVRGWMQDWRAQRVVLVATHEALGFTPDTGLALRAGQLEARSAGG